MGSRKKAKQLDIIEDIKQEAISSELPQNKALTPAEYWEWRCAIADMQTAKGELKNSESQLIILKKDIEIASLKARLYELNQYENAKAKVEKSVKEYEDNKKRLEQVHQISLSGKMIDEITYEIKEVQE